MPKLSTPSTAILTNVTSLESALGDLYFLLSGRIDTDNMAYKENGETPEFSAIPLRRINDLPDDTRPVLGRKLLGNESTTATVTATLWTPLISMAQDNKLYEVLEGTCSFDLTLNTSGSAQPVSYIDRDTGEMIGKTVMANVQGSVTGAQVGSAGGPWGALIGAAVGGAAGAGMGLYAAWNDPKYKKLRRNPERPLYTRKITIEKPVNIVPVYFQNTTEDNVYNLGDTYTQTVRMTKEIRCDRHFSATTTVPFSIEINEPQVSPDEITVDVDLYAPSFFDGEYLKIDVKVSLLCEVLP